MKNEGNQVDRYIHDRNLQEVISKLKFISKIKPNEKVYVSSLTVYEDTLSLKFHRTIFARTESRTATLDFFRSTIEDAIDIIGRLSENDEFTVKIKNMMINELKDCQTGMKNTKVTYSDDRIICARIDTLIETVNARLNEYNS